MRLEELWPNHPSAGEAAIAFRFKIGHHLHGLPDPERYGQFMASADDGTPLGLAEVSVRTDYVNGTETSPVAFLEGLYVKPAARRQGVARALLLTVKVWAEARGCTELASDAQVENRLGHTVHAQLGFTETERVVYFRMALARKNAA